jgi:hypothetical protein
LRGEGVWATARHTTAAAADWRRLRRLVYVIGDTVILVQIPLARARVDIVRFSNPKRKLLVNGPRLSAEATGATGTMPATH